jgi:hypothetical protein
VPSNAVSGGLDSVLNAISFIFPFRACLEAVSNAFTGGSPSIGLPLLHLTVLALVFFALSRVALLRFGER